MPALVTSRRDTGFSRNWRLRVAEEWLVNPGVDRVVAVGVNCCRPEDVARLAALGVIPVPQGRFISEIGDGMLAALGPERSTWCYRQRSFLEAGLPLPGSSDRPVVKGAPLLGIHDMVNQRTASGRPFNPVEALTPEEAIRCYTLYSAHAAFREGDTGSLEPGKLADFAASLFSAKLQTT